MDMSNFFIPEDIIINILSRLPASSVLQCISVCKTWRNLIVHNLEFAYMHLLHGLEYYRDSPVIYSSDGKVNFLLSLSNSVRGYQLYYTVDDDDYERPTVRFRELRLNHPYNNYCLVGSCNGLICMCSGTYNGYEQPIYICNPITRECVYLPGSYDTTNNDPMGTKNLPQGIVCGFGYLPSTNEYKVIRVYYSHGQPFVGRVQVYTLGSGTGWRDKGQISYALPGHCPASPNILVNGALHWLDGFENIVAFDLAEEEFVLLPPPPCFLPRNEEECLECPFRIQVLGGQLYAIYFKNDSSMELWSLKNTKDKNGNYNSVNGWQFWSWGKEFSLTNSMGTQMPFTLTKHGDFLFYGRAELYRYDRKTATSFEICDVEEELSHFNLFQAVPHVNSFVSLKALGEEETKRIELAD